MIINIPQCNFFSYFHQLNALKKETKERRCTDASSSLVGVAGDDSSELKKIKKVQSFFRGWLCRRRWKQIVDQYIKSPHAESMRKRNRYSNIYFSLPSSPFSSKPEIKPNMRETGFHLRIFPNAGYPIVCRGNKTNDRDEGKRKIGNNLNVPKL